MARPSNNDHNRRSGEEDPRDEPRRRSARHRWSRERRRNILLEVLYRRMMTMNPHHRHGGDRHPASSTASVVPDAAASAVDGDGSSQDADESTGRSATADRRQSPPPPPRLRILSDEEAIEREAICRFCFEGPSAAAAAAAASSTDEAPATTAADAGSTDGADALLPPPSSSDDDDSAATTDAPPPRGPRLRQRPPPSLYDDDDDDRRLVSPCRCTGGSEWVHVSCLRRWQLHQARPSPRTSALTGLVGLGIHAMDARNRLLLTSSRRATHCSVCTSQFALRPPGPPRFRRGVVRPGTLLIRRDGEEGGTTSGRSNGNNGGGGGGVFHQSVVLLLGGMGDDGNRVEQEGAAAAQPSSSSSAAPWGVIVNKPLPPSSIPSSARLDVARRPSWRHHHPEPGGSTTRRLEWRKGGPVCGGRLGVTRYLICHCRATPSTLADDDTTTGRRDGFVSLPIFSPPPGCDSIDGRTSQDTASMPSSSPSHSLRFLYESPDRRSPLALDASELDRVVRLSTAAAEETNPSSSSSLSSAAPPAHDVIVFAGYCLWGKGQLEREIRRGMWDVCCGRPGDVVGGISGGVVDGDGVELYAELANRGGRGGTERVLLPMHRVFEDELE